MLLLDYSCSTIYSVVNTISNLKADFFYSPNCMKFAVRQTSEPKPPRTFKHVLCMIRSVIQSYFSNRFFRGSSVTAAQNSRNAFAGPLSLLFGEKGSALRG